MKTVPALIAPALFFSAFSSAAGPAKPEFGGYIENRTTIHLSSEEIISDVAQARIDGNWDFGKSGGIETHLLFTAPLQPLDPFETMRDGSVTHVLLQELLSPLIDALGDFRSTGDTTSGSSPVSEETIDRFLTYMPYSTFYPSDRIALDRALIKAYFRHFDLFIGRQTIAWGTGYAFNPTDVWNSKNPLDPDAPKTGVNALRMEIPLGDLSRISLVASPGREIENSSGGIRFKTNIARFDLSFSGIRFMNADRRLFGLPPKTMTGADLAGQIGDIGVWAEAALNNPSHQGRKHTDFDSCFLQADFGLDYTFPNGLYVMAEYFYNQLGRKSSSEYNSTDLLHLLTGEMPGFARHYLFAGLRYDAPGGISFSAFALGNTVDRSVMLLPSVEYGLTDDINIELGAQVGTGDPDKSEYGSVLPNLYLKVTGFF